MKEIYLPTLHWFAMNNPFSGSCGDLRFMIRPMIVKLNSKEVDMAQSSIQCQYWHGPFCYEKSEIEGQQTFPMSEEGRAAMQQWLQNLI